MEVNGRLHDPAALSPWYPLDRRLGGPQKRFGGGGEGKNLDPTGVTKRMYLHAEMCSKYKLLAGLISEASLSCDDYRVNHVPLNTHLSGFCDLTVLIFIP
jgi:hypothetical protein